MPMKPRVSVYLDALSRKVTRDARFIGSALACMADQNGLNMADMASRLKCPPENLAVLTLCKLPREAAPFFQTDVRSISEYSGCDAEALANLVREFRAINAMRERGKAVDDSMLIAARDKKGKVEEADESDDQDDKT